jgi:hypothetical protein
MRRGHGKGPVEVAVGLRTILLQVLSWRLARRRPTAMVEASRPRIDRFLDGSQKRRRMLLIPSNNLLQKS